MQPAELVKYFNHATLTDKNQNKQNIFSETKKNRFSKMSTKRSRHSRSRTHGSSRHSEEDDGKKYSFEKQTLFSQKNRHFLRFRQ